MGYMKHHSIIVTAWDEDKIKEAHNKAMELFDNKLISELVDGVTNSYKSFFIAPDGSKEGWTESIVYDGARGKFLNWLWKQNYDDGSNIFAWVIVSFDEENRLSIGR